MTHSANVKANILNAGLELWPNVSARGIARKLGMSHSNVLYHFEDVKHAVAVHAVLIGNASIIAQLIASNDETIADLTREERQQYLQGIV